MMGGQWAMRKPMGMSAKWMGDAIRDYGHGPASRFRSTGRTAQMKSMAYSKGMVAKHGRRKVIGGGIAAGGVIGGMGIMHHRSSARTGMTSQNNGMYGY